MDLQQKMINEPTTEEIDRGYSVCKDCNVAIHLYQSGFEVATHMCSQCKCFVADKEDFFESK